MSGVELKYTLDDVFDQACADEMAVSLNGVGYNARLLYGCKIQKSLDTLDIEILNTSQGGAWYQIISNDFKKIFLKKGWRIGVYELSLPNYRLKLDKIELSIKKEMNGKRNPKQIQSLKQARENVLKRYSKIKMKYNQISKK